MDNSIKKDSVNDSSSQKSIISEMQNLIEICSRKLEQDPKHLKALLIRANSYIKTNDFDQAFEDAKTLVEIEPNNSYNHFLIGCILEKLNKIEEAIISFDKALEIDENNVNALFSRGACYNKLGNFIKSIEDYNLAIERDSKQFLKRTSYKNLDKVLEINCALNDYNTIPSSINYTDNNNNDFFESIIITDNSLVNTKNNRIENTFTPITKDKKKQVFKFFNSIKKNKDLPTSSLKVNVVENTSLSQCKSNFSKKSSMKNMGKKRNSERHFNYK